MMNYEVKLTEHAIEQIREIKSYISQGLRAPETAVAWVKKLKNAIASLDFMPHRHALLESDPWHREGVRRLPVGNFFVYYIIDDEHYTVWVIAVIYAKRDQLAALAEHPE